MASPYGELPRLRTELSPRVAAITQEILDVIATNSFPAGHRLGTKAELKRHFAVAEGTLNESLRVLEGHGMIRFRPGPGGGVFVSEPSPELRLNRLILDFKHDAGLVADCLQVREALEPVIVDEACRACQPDDLADLDGLLAAMHAGQNDPADYMRANWDLHRSIAAISPNLVLRTTYTTLLDFVQATVSRVRPVGENRSVDGRDWRVHQRLVEAIGAGDRDRAARALRSHQTLLHPPNTSMRSRT